MPSERIKRRIDRLLDEAEQALDAADWAQVQGLALHVLDLDAENSDALTFLDVSKRRSDESGERVGALERPRQASDGDSPSGPNSFAVGRYTVKRLLGEGGKKRVYLAHDTTLDRDVAFALIKMEGLDDTARERIAREAQAMGRLGAHPHIVTVFDLGEEDGQPYMVTELMGGGDVEGIIEKAVDHRLPLPQALAIAEQVCQGLEFAHGKGIVHRDLKPGNVWLTADDVAKIGDFGLAVSLDRSRLTQAGMMVGTVSYMPPEQAMGGEVTPRSDLYSLGAMLYEMATGRPPFVGDESVAVITQHLNTAPVSPSWHNPSIPPALETLILRLLEKDPGKRPSSAGEVRGALTAVAAQAVGDGMAKEATAHAVLPTLSADNPMYRRTFVGREAELRQLQGAYDAALSGQGSLAMIVGEPGIGKTSLTEQLATYAAIRGGKALVGHCYEEGSLSLPYLPFVEAMRSYVLQREPEGLKSDLGSGAGDVARIVSEVRDRVRVELRPAGDPEEERWRLLQAVSGFLRNASTVQPLLLILEDLHDADRGTLDLLVHLAHNLSGARLLIAGTYRDVEVDRTHPLSGAMAELRRGGNFLRVPLRGLTAEEVQRMMASASQQDIPWPFAELVHRQTEGNPLFVQEMLRYLVEEGLVERREGSLRRVGEETLAGRIPEGLRDVIGKRLSRLSEQTNQALAVASVIGREFRLDVLQRVAGLGDDALEAALKEAMGISIVEEQAAAGAVVTYRFTHAFFRQTLYEETIAPRRIRLHQQVARALEAVYRRRLEEHAAELAEHYAYSSDRRDLRKAVSYGELATKRALSVYAYGEAVRHLEQALKVQEVLDPDDTAKRCDLLLALSEAISLAGEPRRVLDAVAPQAYLLADGLDDRARAARACHVAGEALHWEGALPGFGTPEAAVWAERAARWAAPETAEQVWADLLAGQVRWWSGELGEGVTLLTRALALARRLGEPEALWLAASAWLSGARAPWHGEERLRLAQEMEGWPRAGVRTQTLGAALFQQASALLEQGERARAQAVWREQAILAERTEQATLRLQAIASRGLLATLDGRLEEAVSAGEEIARLGEELGLPAFAVIAQGIASGRAMLHLGRAAELPRIRLGGAEPVFLAYAGRAEEAWSLLDELASRRSGAGSPEDEMPVFRACPLLEVAVLLPHMEAARLLLQYLGGNSWSASSHVAPTCPARHLGAASALLGDRAAARRYYDQALEVAGKIRFRPEIALTHLGIAELLLEESDEAQRIEALGQLDFAIAEFREMKMQPSLERALRHKDLLKA